MPECITCGGVAMAEFARVFGDDTDTVYGCLECLTGTDGQRGAVANVTLERK